MTVNPNTTTDKMNYGIIAAGEGSRLVQEGVSLPKPLVNICGRPMIRRLIDIFRSFGAQRICIIVNEQMTEVADYIRALQKEPGCPIELVVRTTPSSMHSFYELGRLLRDNGRFVLTTVDTIFRPEDFGRYVKAFEEAPREVEGMMAVTRFIDDEKPLYVRTDADMDITGFLDKPAPGVSFISGGIYGLDTSAISVLDRCLESGVSRMRNFQRALVESGIPLKAFDMGKIIDVDHASDIATAEQFLSNPNNG